MSISLTAPQFTEADERRETLGLTVSENERIRRDLYGDPDSSAFDANLSYSNDAIRAMIQRVREALDCIPDRDKSEYLNALQTCPDVVDSESPLESMLRAEDFDEAAAAQRIATYWRLREKVFGEEACSPLINANLGSVEAQRCGAVSILPTDEYGRAVLFFEKFNHRNQSEAGQMILRLVFCCISKLVQIERSENFPSRGVVIIIAEQENFGLDRKGARFMWQIIRDASPLRLRSVHYCVDIRFTQTVTYRLVWPVIKHVMGTRVRRRLVMHVTHPNIDTIAKMETYGLICSNLPVAIGGDYRVDGIAPEQLAD